MFVLSPDCCHSGCLDDGGKPVSILQQPDFQAGKFSGSFDPEWKQMKARK